MSVRHHGQVKPPACKMRTDARGGNVAYCWAAQSVNLRRRLRNRQHTNTYTVRRANQITRHQGYSSMSASSRLGYFCRCRARLLQVFKLVSSCNIWRLSSCFLFSGRKPGFFPVQSVRVDTALEFSQHTRSFACSPLLCFQTPMERVSERNR